jgi:hypothetical protein
MTDKKPRKRFKTEQIKTYVFNAFEDAKSDISELAQEMRSWEENMGQYDGFSATERYNRVSQSADTLEDQSSELDNVEEITEEQYAFVEIQVFYIRPYGRKPMPRWMRLSNALNDLTNVVKALREKKENDIADEIETIIGELEGVDFPSMYG